MKIFILPMTIIVLFVGCNANINLSKLDIASNELDFGIVELNKSVFQSIEVYNKTQNRLKVFIDFICDPDSAFELISNGGTEIIQPGETIFIEIKFNSDTLGEKSAKLELSYKNIGIPTVINMCAKCIKYDIQLHPYAEKIDFKNTSLNSSNLRVLNIKNVGNSPLEVNSITFEKTTCFTFYTSTLPVTLDENELMLVLLYFSPVNTKEISDTMRVYYSESDIPLEVELSGNGISYYVYDFMPIEYFNDDEMPTNWSIEGINNSWEIGKPDGFSNFQSYSGENCVGTTISGNYIDNSDTRLISPVVDLSRSCNPVLSFVHFVSTIYEQYGDGGFIEIRNSNTGEVDTWSEWEVLSNITPNYSVSNFSETSHGAFAGIAENYNWKTMSVDLGAYRGKYVQIAWHFMSDASENSQGWYIENVHVFEIRNNTGS